MLGCRLWVRADTDDYWCVELLYVFAVKIKILVSKFRRTETPTENSFKMHLNLCLIKIEFFPHSISKQRVQRAAAAFTEVKENLENISLKFDQVK